MSSLLSRLGAASARHRWIVIAVWLVILLAGVLAAMRWSQPLNDTFSVPGLSSVDTLNKVDAEFGSGGDGASGRVVFAAPAGEKLTAADAATVAHLAAGLSRVDGVRSAPDPFAGAPTSLSPNRRVGYVTVTLTHAHADGATVVGIAHAMSDARSAHLQVAASSELVSDSGAGSSPIVGIILAFVVLLVTFGTLLGAGMPLITALIGLATSMAGIYAATSFTDVSSVAPALAILLGLAVGIDYALFIVSRHRRQLLTGMAVRESIARAVGTAGTAVVFAGVTVIVALAGLAIMGIGFVAQMGLAGAFAVLVALLISITLTPALLSLTGMRLLSRRARRRMTEPAPADGTAADAPRRRPLAGRWAGTVSRHPVLVVIGGLALLVVLALPVTTLRLGLPNDATQPSSTSERQAADLLADGFGAGVNGPLVVLASYPRAATPADVAALTAKLGGVAGVAHAIPSGVNGDDALVTVIPRTGPSTAATETLVTTLRAPSVVADVVGSPRLRVTGETAVAIDVSQRLTQALPLYLIVVVGFAFLLLLVVFRSLVIPLKATAGFLLSLGASLGVTVAVFQWGWLGPLFRVDPAGPLLSFLPVLIVGVLFGLSMDYEMFLVTGMREEHARGAAPRDAVLTGFAHGARVVVAAALIMVGVFGNGAFTGSALTRPIAFALAVGILVDAFVVRMALVPAAMTLFGRASWWLPRWLARIVPDVDIEGASLDVEATSAPVTNVILSSSDLS